ncbi:MAG: hypothetical protein KatS3mg050_3635 [Litorilinea sp.]|nr:MAG: hypothetical protein KatS3mg050_3635 [Litorilinea sp.]
MQAGGVAGHKKDGEPRVEGLQPFGQLWAAHFGHDHVTEQQIDVGVGVFGQLQGFAGAARSQHDIPQIFQQRPDHIQHGRLILHHQNTVELSTNTEGSNTLVIAVNGVEQDRLTSSGQLCTGRIIVIKRTVPEGAAGQFSFTGDLGEFDLGDGESHDSGPLLPGTYQVAEAPLPRGWTLQEATCDDGSEPGSIDLAAGETVTCTFVNALHDLALVKSLPEVLTTIRPGDAVTFTIHVTNQGGDTATDVVVVDYIRPQDFTFNPADNPQWTVGANHPTTLIPSIGPGETVSVPIILRVSPDVLTSRSLENCAEIYTDSRLDIDSTPGNYTPDGPVEDDNSCVEIPATFVEPLNPTGLDPRDQPPAPGTQRIFLPLVQH